MFFLNIKKIPLTYKRVSLRINLREMTVIPFCMIFCQVISISMALPDIGAQTLSYVNFACFMASFIFMLALYLHAAQMTRFGLLHFLLMLTLIFSTVINNINVKTAIYQSFYVWQTLIIFNYYKIHTEKIIKFFAISLSFCVYANLAHLITHPTLWMVETGKEGAGYLLGNNYNQMGCRLIIALGTNILCVKYNKLWLVNYIATAISAIVSLFMVGSMTSLSMIILFTLYTLIPFAKLKKNILITTFIIFILFQFFVVFNGRGLENNDLARYLVEDVLHKDLTFTHRTYLWDAALKIIPKSPIWGYGLVEGEWYKAHMSSIAMGPHNFILAVLLNGGIILLIFYSIICGYSINSIRPYFKDTEVKNLIFSTICLWIMALMEMYPYTIMLYPLALIYNYQNIKTKQ